MRVAVISDVHGNLHALERVLAEIETAAADELWCLGDTVGYGPRPNECCAAIAPRAAVCLAGNHDLVVLGSLDIADFSGDAGRAAAWTRDVLTDDARDFLAGLRTTGSRPGVELFHGSPRNPVWDYVLSEEVAAASLRATSEPIVLVGHSHVALGLRDEGDAGVSGGLAPAGTELELGDDRWLLNPGSVGQPRDGDPRAAWLLLDLRARRASFRRVEYDVAAAQQAFRDAGLPDSLAQRLDFGQ
jgi:diadenosine tetraphosphatase ApaH/serine/threonine PP2A family protein phosphatase